MEKHIKAPISKEVSRKLRAGDYVYITGTIYTARDAAHKRMDDALKNGENLPVDMVGQTIYYMGPSPAREGRPIGSAGPTTASRMDRYAPKLLDLGLTAMIGKGITCFINIGKLITCCTNCCTLISTFLIQPADKCMSFCFWHITDYIIFITISIMYFFCIF